MNKVINGKLYNTDKAKKLGYTDNDLPQSDFSFWCETLYRTRSGNYFLHCEGGGNSKHGKWIGNTGGRGEKIEPLSEEAAREWAEHNLLGDEYEMIFGELSGDKEKISADLHPQIKVKLDEIRGDKSYGEIITEMVSGYKKSK